MIVHEQNEDNSDSKSPISIRSGSNRIKSTSQCRKRDSQINPILAKLKEKVKLKVKEQVRKRERKKDEQLSSVSSESDDSPSSLNERRKPPARAAIFEQSRGGARLTNN